MTQGRPKGCKAEIEVAKIVEPWWSDFEPLAPDGHPIRFVRTPLSGGWGGKDTRSGFRASGDLMTTAAKFPFTVEVKRREGWSWKTLAEGARSPVWGWWKQAIEQAREMNAVPMLWFRKNREPWHVMIPMSLWMCPFVVGRRQPVYAWYPREVRERASVHPIVLTKEAFLEEGPKAWAAAARSFAMP